MPLASTSTLPLAVSATLAGSGVWASAMEAPSESTAPAIAATKICLMIETPGFLEERLFRRLGFELCGGRNFSFLPRMVQQNGRIAKPARDVPGHLLAPVRSGRIRNCHCGIATANGKNDRSRFCEWLRPRCDAALQR